MNDGVWARYVWWEEPSSPYPSAEPLVPNSKTAKIQLGRWIYSVYYSKGKYLSEQILTLLAFLFICFELTGDVSEFFLLAVDGEPSIFADKLSTLTTSLLGLIVSDDSFIT